VEFDPRWGVEQASEPDEVLTRGVAAAGVSDVVLRLSAWLQRFHRSCLTITRGQRPRLGQGVKEKRIMLMRIRRLGSSLVRSLKEIFRQVTLVGFLRLRGDRRPGKRTSSGKADALIAGWGAGRSSPTL